MNKTYQITLSNNDGSTEVYLGGDLFLKEMASSVMADPRFHFMKKDFCLDALSVGKKFTVTSKTNPTESPKLSVSVVEGVVRTVKKSRAAWVLEAVDYIRGLCGSSEGREITVQKEGNKFWVTVDGTHAFWTRKEERAQIVADALVCK